MENRTPGFHIEFPMVHSEEGAAEKLLSSKKVGEYEVVSIRKLNYIDTYWDTPNGDLHSSSRLLRTRAKGEGTDFIDYKGSPQYLHQSLFARPLYSEKISSESEATDALCLKRPSEPIQALFRDRFDLLGNPLIKKADCHVERINFDLTTQSGEGFCTISVHKYYFCTINGKTDIEDLLEIQPYCKVPIITEKLPKIFSIAKRELEKLGWKFSPTSKYHRLDRKYID